MVAKISSVALVGMDARPVEVEVDLGVGLPDFHVVGLPSAAIKEARRRVRSAVENSQHRWPQHRVTANLAPADLRKDGSLFDLPMAVGVLSAAGHIKGDRLAKYMLVGELALDGRLRPVRGALAAALAARDGGHRGILLPSDNAAEASLVSEIEVVGAGHLVEALEFLGGGSVPPTSRITALDLLSSHRYRGPDLSEVRGQAVGVRAMEIAATGGHNLLLVGPPGCGKTMLAERMPGILPPLSEPEAMELTRIWSVAGLLGPSQPMVTERPFRCPHHHASASAIVGGGASSVIRPGEISLAHHGVLFMDELPLFSRMVLDALREPLTQGFVTVVRQGAAARFPSNICLVAAANPCLCGGAGDPRKVCTCAEARLQSYRSKLSGPLLDRIDIHVDMPSLTEEELFELEPAESSAEVRDRVILARSFRAARLESEEGGEYLELRRLATPVRKYLRGALALDRSSARGLASILRVARSIADLAASATIAEEHVAEAIQLRRGVWRQD
jgi:magnesium chelatase family protein